MSIKNELLCKGYYCDDFLRLKHTYDTSGASYSREILLAIGWFISNQKIIEKFIYNTSCAFDFECGKELALEVKINFSFDFVFCL